LTFFIIHTVMDVAPAATVPMVRHQRIMKLRRLQAARDPHP
jgi:hypothetical protein